MTEREVQDVIHALETLSKHKAVIGCESCAKTAEFALNLLKEQEGTIRGLESCLQETLEELTNARKETETETSENSVKQEDVAEIMNTINDALEGSGYCAVGYDNTGMFLQVLIECLQNNV